MDGMDGVLRSDSVQAVLRWHEQGQKRLSIGLELEAERREMLRRIYLVGLVVSNRC